jgi:hypothetical protein
MRLPRSPRFAHVLLASALLTACAASPWESGDVTHRPEALLDAYLIAHGMATSYAQSDDARPDVVLQLRNLDLRAAQSIRELGHAYPANVEATVEAVAALTDYAARQSTKPQ